MSLVNLVQVEILDAVASYCDPFRFEITFEVVQELEQDVEFKVVYVGSPERNDCDQTLEAVMVGPVPVGVSKFVLEAPAPNPEKIAKEDIEGLTVVILAVFYRQKEFVRVGYYVNNAYDDEALVLEPPQTPIIDKLKRCILADKPRVTRFSIPWYSLLIIGIQLKSLNQYNTFLIHRRIVLYNPQQWISKSNLNIFLKNIELGN
jgi:histone chaperone ASF1